MSKFYTYSVWENTFKPIENPIQKAKHPEHTMLTFETYDEEYELVKQAHANNPNTVWTEVDGDEGTYIISGLHWVNRIHYYITENPWEDEYTEVPTWVYRPCDCQDETEDGEFNPECTECDEGLIDIDCDTVEALKQIYGEDNADIVA
jgi:hypothetical protein